MKTRKNSKIQKALFALLNAKITELGMVILECGNKCGTHTEEETLEKLSYGQDNN